jgi:hypothetical protein
MPVSLSHGLFLFRSIKPAEELSGAGIMAEAENL